MPPLQGEERVLTVFADIHSYFTVPSPKPLHHRFDKGSYLYLHYNATQQKIRVEVANNPGTPEQDSFNGALDRVHIRHSTRFPTLCTLTVDGKVQPQGQQDFPPPPGANAYEWLLPSGDTREESERLLLLHTLDIYFWTSDDATQFLDLVERCLSQSQVETDRRPFPPPPQTTATSTVVQQLENVAITDPAYQNGQTRNSQSEAAVANPVLQFQSMIVPGSLPPPPPLNGPPPSNVARGPSADEQKDPSQFTPLPYNPAAPAAPEPIQHREKTPPPVDGAEGTGLAAAVAADDGIPYGPPSQLSGVGNFAPPPPATQGLPYSMPGSYASPPPSAGLTHSTSFSSRSSIQSPPGVPSYTPSFHASTTQAANPPPVQMSFAPPPKDPNAHLYGQTQNLYGSQPQTQPTSPPPPVGGYSNYSYEQPARRQSTNSEYDIHKQMYRPTEAEATSHHQKYAQQAMQNPGQRPRKFEESASRVESGVNRFLKKLEKKL